MKLTGRQFEYLQGTFLSVFRNQSQLERMVRIELDENLNAIAGGDNLTDTIFGLVSWAEQHNRVDDLIDAAIRTIPTNLELQKLKIDINQWPEYLQESTKGEESLYYNKNSRRGRLGLIIATLAIIVALAVGLFVYYGPLNFLEQGADALLQAGGESGEVVSDREFATTEANDSVGTPATDIDSQQVYSNTEAFVAEPTGQNNSTQSSAETTGQFSTIASNITNNPGQSKSARLFVDSEGHLHLFHHDNTPRQGSTFDLLHRQRLPDGTWSNETNLTRGMDILSIRPAYPLINRDNTLCVFWWGATISSNPSTGGMYMRCYDNEQWTAAEQLDNSVWSIPAFRADGSVQIIDKVSPTNVQINNFELADGFKYIQVPQFVVDTNNRSHATWMRVGDPVSFEHRFLDDGSLNWNEQVRLADRNVTAQYELQADNDGNVHFVWGNHTIFYRKWTDQNGWGDAVELSNDGGQDTRLAIDAVGMVHVIWRDIYEVLYTKQIDTNEWATPMVVLPKVNGQGIIDIAVDHSNVVYISWQDDTDALDIHITELKPQSAE